MRKRQSGAVREEAVKRQGEEGEEQTSKGSEKVLSIGETLIYTIGINCTRFGNEDIS